MNNVTRQGGWDFSRRRRVPATRRDRDAFTLAQGDVLFNATNSPELVGKSALLGPPDEPMVFSNHFLRLRTNRECLEPAFLARWLHRQFTRGVFQAMCRQWVNQATVGRDSLLSLEMPLPPIEEQQRIAEVLDRADALRAKRRKAITLLDELTQSIFLDMFSDPRHGWGAFPSDCFANVVGRVTYGFTSPMRHVDAGIPIVTAKTSARAGSTWTTFISAPKSSTQRYLRSPSHVGVTS
ncbi:MAG: restriction endonuclease subunit S [Nocardioidaceae bacterium]